MRPGAASACHLVVGLSGSSSRPGPLFILLVLNESGVRDEAIATREVPASVHITGGIDSRSMASPTAWWGVRMEERYEDVSDSFIVRLVVVGLAEPLNNTIQLRAPLEVLVDCGPDQAVDTVRAGSTALLVDHMNADGGASVSVGNSAVVVGDGAHSSTNQSQAFIQVLAAGFVGRIQAATPTEQHTFDERGGRLYEMMEGSNGRYDVAVDGVKAGLLNVALGSWTQVLGASETEDALSTKS